MDIEVSVIIPCYNGESWLLQAYECLQKTRMVNCEFIFINDGSSDNSNSILENIRLKDNRVQLIVKSQNEGLPAARNTGIRVSNGKYIIFYDCDDIIDIDAIEKIINKYKNLEFDVIWSSYVSFAYDTKPGLVRNDGDINIYSKTELIKLSLVDEKIPISIWTGVYNAKKIKEIPVFFDEKLNFAEDQQFLIDVLVKMEKCFYVDLVTYYYRVGHSSMSYQAVEKRVTALLRIYENIKNQKHPIVELYKERRLRIWISMNAYLLPLSEWSKFIAKEVEYLKFSHYIKHISQGKSLRSFLKYIQMYIFVKLKYIIFKYKY